MKLIEVINIKHNGKTLMSIMRRATGVAKDSLVTAYYLGRYLEQKDIKDEDLVSYITNFLTSFTVDKPTELSENRTNVVVHHSNENAKEWMEKLNLSNKYSYIFLGLTPSSISYLNDWATCTIELDIDEKCITQNKCIVKRLIVDENPYVDIKLNYNVEEKLSYSSWEEIINALESQRYRLRGCTISTPVGAYTLYYSLD